MTSLHSYNDLNRIQTTPQHKPAFYCDFHKQNLNSKNKPHPKPQKQPKICHYCDIVNFLTFKSKKNLTSSIEIVVNVNYTYLYV